MGQSINLLLLFLPPEMLGLLSVVLIVSGGILIMLSARRQGTALVLTGISLPLITVLIEALMNDLFMALPDRLVMPMAIALQIIIYITIGWSLLKSIVGQRAIDEAKGHLLADAVKWLLRRSFSRYGVMVLGSVLVLSWLS